MERKTAFCCSFDSPNKVALYQLLFQHPVKTYGKSNVHLQIQPILKISETLLLLVKTFFTK